MSYTDEEIEKIQKIDPFKDKDYDSSMFPYFTDRQIFDTTHYLVKKLLAGIRELKGDTSIIDVGVFVFSTELLKEVKKRMCIYDEDEEK